MLSDWDHWYPRCEPIGHHLRTAFPNRWVRFHSLPESKRYPEQEAEYAEVLARHNAILGELAERGEPVVLLTTGYSDSPGPRRIYPELESLDPDPSPWRTCSLHDPNDPSDRPMYWHVFANYRIWYPGEFDPLVRLVADDVIANVLVVSTNCRWVLHPYDGGMDVIVESGAERDSLASHYSGWLSAHPGGL